MTNNLVPRVLSYPPYGARERHTLENAGHVAPEQNQFLGRSPLSHFFFWFIRNVHAVIVTAR